MAIIACPETYQCTIECGGGAGSEDCMGTTIACSQTGVCYLGCVGAASCAGAVMGCGNNACTANCSGGANKPIVGCGKACGCNGC
jgi:hypothetical protein